MQYNTQRVFFFLSVFQDKFQGKHIQSQIGYSIIVECFVWYIFCGDVNGYSTQPVNILKVEIKIIYVKEIYSILGLFHN